MTSSFPQPHTIDSLRFGADSALAMLAGIELEVFTPLRNGPMTATQIADAIGVPPTRLRLLLYALVVAGLLTEQEGHFANTPEAQHFLVKDTSTYLGPLIARNAYRWNIKLKTAASIRTGVPQTYLNYAQGCPTQLETFLRSISVSTVAAAQALLARADFSPATTLADVGGGSGKMAMTLAQAHPHLRATVIDLPLVTSITQKIVNESGMADRVAVRAADVVSGPLPGTYDVMVARELLQVLSPDQARRAIDHMGQALNAGGALYIMGQVLDDSRRAPLDAVGFNLIFINENEAGESYTEREHRAWLEAAGLIDITRVRELGDGGSGLITARKPGV